MIYKTDDPYLSGVMDRYITGNYGEDEYDGYFDGDNEEEEDDDEYPQKCDRCGERFLRGDEFYELKKATWNYETLCRSCAEDWLDEQKEIK